MVVPRAVWKVETWAVSMAHKMVAPKVKQTDVMMAGCSVALLVDA